MYQTDKEIVQGLLKDLLAKLGVREDVAETLYDDVEMILEEAFEEYFEK